MIEIDGGAVADKNYLQTSLCDHKVQLFARWQWIWRQASVVGRVALVQTDSGEDTNQGCP